MKISVVFFAAAFSSNVFPQASKDVPDFCRSGGSGAVECLKERARDGAMSQSYERVDTTGLEGTIASLASSKDHVCAITTAGRVYCWGSNLAGKLGLGGIGVRQLPADDGEWSIAAASPGIPFPTEPVAGTFRAVSAYGNGSCALSDEARDNAYCWGRIDSIEGLAEHGEKFAAASASRPRRIDLSLVPERQFIGIASGPLAGFGWTASNAVYRWGWGGFRLVGKLPAHLRIERLSPVRNEVCAMTTTATYCSKNGEFSRVQRSGAPF